MNNRILLNSASAVFEPHIFRNRNLPLILHNNSVRGTDFANFHESLEILYFKRGDGYVKYNGEALKIKAGDIVIVNSYVTHQIFAATDELERICLIIDNDFCKRNNVDASRLRFKAVIGDKAMCELLDKLSEVFAGSSSFKALEINSLLLNILLYICKNFIISSTEAPEAYIAHSFIPDVIEYIKKNFEMKLTVDEIADYAGLSKYHFLREFKKYTGYTLTNYINIIRCEYAKELLNNSSSEIKSIAISCGFNTTSYFTDTFKKITGMLPSEYRNKSI